MVTFIKHLRLVLVGTLLSVLLVTGIAPAVQAENTSPLAPEMPDSLQAFGLNYEWHTFFGVGDSTGELRSLAVDADGNVYVAGYNSKSWGSPLHAFSGDYDVVIIKLNSKGQYLWHTFFGASPDSGSSGDDEAAGIALDQNGDVYVTGYSDKSWQGPGNTDPLNPPIDTSETMFVLKLDKNGAYLWHTFYQPGRAKAIATDSSNNVYISGSASSSWGVPLHASSGAIFALKLNSNGAYQWHTYYGAGPSSVDEAPYGIAVDRNSSAVYVTGQTPNTWLGDSNTPPLHPFSGGPGFSSDIFVLKLNSAGAYQWHSFYGVSDTDDTGNAVAVDSVGNAYIVGRSFYSWGSPLHPKSGENDLFVLKLNSMGTTQWNTFYGSGGSDDGTGIVMDGNDNAYIVGTSPGTWQGDNQTDPVHPYSGGGSGDILVLKLSSIGAYRLHTFYGADSSPDDGYAIGLGSDDAVFTTGYSLSTWNGDNNAAPIHSHSGNVAGDGSVLKLSNRVFNIFLPLSVR